MSAEAWHVDSNLGRVVADDSGIEGFGMKGFVEGLGRVVLNGTEERPLEILGVAGEIQVVLDEAESRRMIRPPYEALKAPN